MWHQSSLKSLSAQPVCGYLPHDLDRQPPAAEPTALAALALLAFDKISAAQRAAEWLATIQMEDGSVPVRRNADGPGWPTGLAVMVWQTVNPDCFAGSIDRAVTWMLTARGKTQERSPEVSHDPTLTAWPWVDGTHAWVEPTAIQLLGLKSTSYSGHQRVHEAVRMLLDRQIPGGGCNYGNTGVLGQTLRPHVQPTGLALWALGGEDLAAGTIDASLAWLKRSLDARTTSMSLAWGLLGLGAHGALPADANKWIQRAHSRNASNGNSAYKAALLLLAERMVAGKLDLPPLAQREPVQGISEAETR